MPTAYQSFGLEEKAVWLAGELHDALYWGDDLYKQQLLPQAISCRQQLEQKLFGSTKENRFFLQAALGHLNRAIAAATRPPIEFYIALPKMLFLPERIPERIPCACGSQKEKGADGQFRCAVCATWLHLEPLPLFPAV